MKKLTKIVLVAGALIAALIIGLYLYMYLSKKVEVASFDGYYGELARQCERKSGFSCCISSVRTMKRDNYKLSENNNCGDGFKSNMLMCIDSFKWCEPVTVKPSSEVLETGEETTCNSDKDCWCRIFDGTGFQPGKVPSRCNLQTKKCAQCYYE